MNIEFERDGIVKTTHEKFTDDLIAVGWKVVAAKEEPKVIRTVKPPAKKTTKKVR